MPPPLKETLPLHGVVIVAHAISGFHTGICCWGTGVGVGEEVVSKHTHAGFSRHASPGKVVAD